MDPVRSSANPLSPPDGPRSLARRIALIAAEALLILVVTGLIAAIWLPAIVAPASELPQRDGPPRFRMQR